MFGQSSDGQFMYNTGIYPLTDEITLSIERRGPFPSLCRELDGYHAEEFIGEDKKLWFHDESSVAYGYDRLTDRLGVHDINRCDEAIMSASLRSLKGAATTVLRHIDYPHYAWPLWQKYRYA